MTKVTIEFVPFALVAYYNGAWVCAVGLPIFLLWPRLEAWLQTKAEDL